MTAQGQIVSIYESPRGFVDQTLPLASGEDTQKGGLLMVSGDELLAADDAVVGAGVDQFGGISRHEAEAGDKPERFIPEWFDVLDDSGALTVGETAYLKTPSSVTNAAGATENHPCGVVIGLEPNERSSYVRVATELTAT